MKRFNYFVHFWVSLFAFSTISLADLPKNPFSAIWVNDGLDKVAQEELRVSGATAQTTKNNVWSNNVVHLDGAKNEIVSFNVIFEAQKQNSGKVEFLFNKLIGPDKFSIQSHDVSKEGAFNWSEKNIETFFIKYLPIHGLSRVSYEVYDERHVPKRFQRKWKGPGLAHGKWADRPDHDKHYPEIAVPLETFNYQFEVEKGKNQSIWVDVYIPKNAPVGSYSGNIQLLSNRQVFKNIPVELTVNNFTLPDIPTNKTMVFLGYQDILDRYLGKDSGKKRGLAPSELKKIQKIRDRHFQLAHRHKISLIDANPDGPNTAQDSPSNAWQSRLDGSLFTRDHNYDGPGYGVGNNVYCIGAYGSWKWLNAAPEVFELHAKKWVEWFEKNSPQTERFLYLIDESTEFEKIEKWAKQTKQAGLASFATMPLPDAVEKCPDLQIVASTFIVGPTALWQKAYQKQKSKAGYKFYLYNGKRPATGSFAIEDDGIALRELAWVQFARKIDRWFYWESTYYNNYQGGLGDTDVFSTAQTFGGKAVTDPALGKTSWNYANGDGVLFYPGTDKVYPQHSLNLNGPLASLRLKYWRRGIQDADYLALAEKKNATATKAIIKRMIPLSLWDYGVDKPAEPTWVRTDISWSTNEEDWEDARKKLSSIIVGESEVNTPPPTLRDVHKPESSSFYKRYIDEIERFFLRLINKLKSL